MCGFTHYNGLLVTPVLASIFDICFPLGKTRFHDFFQLYRLLNTSWPRNWSFTMGRWGHKLDLVICFDRRSMRLNCILHDLFRDCTCTCERNSLWLTLVHSDSLLLTLALSDPLMLYLWLNLSFRLALDWFGSPRLLLAHWLFQALISSLRRSCLAPVYPAP